jgi:hypothetical protein
MEGKWYYASGSDKVGPVDKSEIEDLFAKGKILKDTYVWTEGMENWTFLEEADQFSELFMSSTPPSLPDLTDIPPPPVPAKLEWDNLDPEKPQFAIRIGEDRGGDDKVLGLFTLNQFITFGEQNRINEKTLVYAKGMDSWESLGNLPIYAVIFPEEEPRPVERREGLRKPITARILFHDETEVFDGLVADISEGGLKIFINDFPGKVGDEISMNVHPEESEHSFVAKGEVVHVLDGNIGFSVKFVDLDSPSQDAIKSFLKK